MNDETKGIVGPIPVMKDDDPETTLETFDEWRTIEYINGTQCVGFNPRKLPKKYVRLNPDAE